MTIEALIHDIKAPCLVLLENLSSDIKIQKIALAALSAVSALLASSVVAAVSTGVFSFSLLPICIPFAACSFLAFQILADLKDYNDPLELHAMREKAKILQFSEILQEHGSLEKVFAYKIIDPTQLRAKFFLEQEEALLSKLLSTSSFSSLKKYHLLSLEKAKELFVKEMREMENVSALYERFSAPVLYELAKENVIESNVYEALEECLVHEEKVAEEKRQKLINIHLSYLERRECILAELERKEKKGQDDIHKAYASSKPVPSSFLKSLQNQLKAIEIEKLRVEKDPTIGEERQKLYDEALVAIYEEFSSKELENKEAFIRIQKQLSG